jgi:hypothetical protein
MIMRVERFSQNPIIGPHMDARMGENINGPSLIRAPEWLPNPLGRYYLYFGHHQGQYIRLAYADRLEGPWRTYEPGTLTLEQSIFRSHIASPDVHLDEERRQVRMYYHGVYDPERTGPLPKGWGAAVAHAAGSPNVGQWSTCALSEDGIHFRTLHEVMATSYMRAFRWDGWWYALSMPGHLFRSRDGLGGYETGPLLFDPDFRHAAVLVGGHTLQVFYSHVGDCPERILCATIDLRGDWRGWRASEPVTVLEPQYAYEGADLPLEPSVRGWAPERARQLRDPGIYREDGETYLIYSVAGEYGLGVARVV